MMCAAHVRYNSVESNAEWLCVASFFVWDFRPDLPSGSLSCTGYNAFPTSELPPGWMRGTCEED